MILLVVFTSATSAPSGFSKMTASPAPAWMAPVAAAGDMVSIWTAADEATRTCTGNKVRQMGQYTVGANQENLKTGSGLLSQGRAKGLQP